VTTRTHAQAPLIQAERLIIIVGKASRYTAWYCEWNGQVAACRGHDHLTRQDALTCAEQRLRYRALTGGPGRGFLLAGRRAIVTRPWSQRRGLNGGWGAPGG
jgi:hypothetical protein